MNRWTKPALLAAALLVSTMMSIPVRAQSDKTPADVYAFKVGRILTGDGGEIVNGVIVVIDGRIAAVGADVKIPPGATRVIDLSRCVVIPGLVNPLTYVAKAARDDAETATPDVRAVDGVDRFAPNRKLLEGGVTAFYAAPGRVRLISGMGAAVCSSGAAAKRILAPAAALRINLDYRAENPPALFDPPVPPEGAQPYRPARRQLPSSRAGALLKIRETFRAARAYFAARDAAPTSTAPRPGRNLAYEALRPVLAGKTPVRFHARLAVDILNALALAREFDLDCIIVGATEAYRVVDELAAAKVAVVVDVNIDPDQLSRSDDTRQTRDGRADLRNAARLAARGVAVALCLPESAEPGRLLLAAGYAARSGMPADRALRAVTSVAAKVSGAASEVGTLARGMRADFVVLDRDPFDMRAQPLAVYAGGRRVFRRAASRPAAEVLAVSAARIMTMAGSVLEDATILIEDGRIVDLGRAVRIPSTARRIEVKHGVVTPGFIDTLSHVGTHTDQLGTAPAPRPTVARMGRPRRGPRPMVRPASRPRGDRSAAVSVKENLADVIRPGDEGYAELLRAGVTTVILGPDGESAAQLTAVRIGARDADDLVLARVAGLRHPLKLPPATSRETAAKGLDAVLKRAKAYVESFAKYAKDLAAYRELQQAAAAGDEEQKKALAKAKEPKKPKRDPVNEAWRAVLENRAAVVVPIRREDTIRAALEVFARHGVKPVLQEANEAHLVLKDVQRLAAGVLVRPPFVTRDPEGARVFNAGVLGDGRVDLAFYSDGRSGGKYLPLHAAAAVREGLDPDAALRGLTVTAARLFRIHEHVGSLEVGKLGDLVVFSGDPFDLTSRVVLVVAGGRVVYDARTGNRKGAH